MPKLVEVSDEYLYILEGMRAVVKVMAQRYREGGKVDRFIPMLENFVARTEDSDAHKLENLAEGMKDVVSPPTSQGER